MGTSNLLKGYIEKAVKYIQISAFFLFNLSLKKNMNLVEARPRNNIQSYMINHRSKSEYISKPKRNKFRPHSMNIQPSTNVFINYIPAYYNENDLRSLCSKYGTIICSKIMINLETGQSKCFGFVRFATLEQAQNAIKELNGMKIGNKTLLAKYAESHEKKEKASTIIYVKRVPIFVDWRYTLHLFGQFGQIVQILPHIIDANDRQFWRCFIQYTSFQEAANAISEMNNKIIYPGTRPIHVKYADETRLGENFKSMVTGIFTYASSIVDEVDERKLLPSFLFQ